MGEKLKAVVTLTNGEEVEVELSGNVVTKEDLSMALNANSIAAVKLPDGVVEIGNSAFSDYNHLTFIDIPEGVVEIGDRAFQDCSSLTSIKIPEGIIRIGREAFQGCNSLSLLHLPSDLNSEYVMNGALYNVPQNCQIEYKNHVFKSSMFEATKNLSNGLDSCKCFEILGISQDILKDNTFSPILIQRLCNAEHAGKLNEAAEKIAKDFQTIGFYQIDSKIDLFAKKCLTELFEKNEATHGHVPKIIDALTIASTTLNIQPELIVKKFESKGFREAVSMMRSNHNGNHFFDTEAALFALTFDPAQVKSLIMENPYKDFASVLLCSGYKDRNPQDIETAKWIAKHPNANIKLVGNIYQYKDYLTITADMSVDRVNTLIEEYKGKLEIKAIEKEYEGFSFENCKCNLPKTEVELGKYKAYIMDADDPRQVMLGYDTCCCQHLKGAGETAMMYGLVNPNAGFWVIEDKESGKILAQAECWEITSAKLNESILTENIIKELLNGAISQGYIHVNDISKCFNNSVKNIQTGVVTYFDGRDYDPNDFALKIDKAGLITETSLISNGSYLNISDYKFNLFENDNVRNGFNAYCNDNNIDMAAFQNGDIQIYKNCFVFDNIEFADDRQIDQFAPIIAKWCEASPYQNILMGNGYNKMVNGDISKTFGIEPPVTAEILSVLDNEGEINTLEEIIPSGPDEAYEILANNNLNDDDFTRNEQYEIQEVRENIMPYTDADESCSIIKKSGVVEPYFKDKYEEYIKEHPQEQVSEQAPTISPKQTPTIGEPVSTQTTSLHHCR